MRLGKRQRVEELPFAGMHDVAADLETASFAVYGVAATLHPLDQSNDDEGAELVPWPEDSSDPVLVDRFDCRLLLDPSELIDTFATGRSRQGRGEAASSSPDNPAAELEAELEEQRWKDLFHPPHLQQHVYYISEIDEEEEEREKRARGAAIPFDYLNTAIDAEAVTGERERVYYLEDLVPPPPPPYLDLHNNQSKPSLTTLLNSSGGGSNNNNTANSHIFGGAGLVSFTAQQYAIMQRTAEFLHAFGDHGGAEILFERAFNDPTFAFISPCHVWNDFFKGLVEKLASVEPFSEAQKVLSEKQQQEDEEKGNFLVALLGGYGSEEEEEEEEEKKENEEKKEELHCRGRELEVVTAIIARLIKSATQNNGNTSTTNHNMAVAVKERLFTDPLIASIVHPEAPFFNVFKDAVESAVATGAMNGDTATVWLGHAMNAANIDGVNAAVKRQDKERESAALPAPAAKEEKIRKERKPTTGPPEIDESKKEDRKKKARLLLQRQRQVAEQRRLGQAVAQKHAEEERNQHLAAISVHKRMFLDNSDDE
ncbi:hypothetical protein NADE_002985 [Nannochloris sp. 'desiccata']|nr:hypothetical protein KSW81_000956 [Chlorella desiccata (nom. nud.)]KAH7620359.1 hypothetical protein NADE_002985 [Chlorella desiccata (nom. nud.)]